MNILPINNRRVRGFTLIELLVVIAIIGVLAALLLPGAAKIHQRMAIKKAEASLANIQMAINSYKGKIGHYPPDNPADSTLSPLYYELAGCVRTNIGVDYFMTIDGSAKIKESDMLPTFGQGGIANCSTGGGGDEGGGSSFRALTEIRPDQYGETAAGNGIRVLGVQVKGPPPTFPSSSGIAITPFHYISSNPTNNQNSFDLWIDILVGNKTNRINNWGPPIINP